ncbi:MAG: hypothetical protein ACQRW7_11090 [Caulobacterales bacterium]|uniref:hypothetical protein n=1 Tax=Glycocaulis sp. TaxID=1969725 RepID=UPI003FA010CA
MRGSAHPGGMLAAIIIAPAFAAFLAVLGLIAHLQMTDPAAAEVPLAEYASMGLSVWISGLMFAYPAAFLIFLPLWLVLKGVRLWGGFTALLAGGVAGLIAMMAYLYRIYGSGLELELTGGIPLGELPLMQSLISLALPLIGAASGAVGGLVFSSLERAGR